MRTLTPPAPVAMTPFDEVNDWSLRATLNFYWFVFWLFSIGLAITLGWDGWWHSTRVFDTAFSPPHMFGYDMASLTAILAARLAFVPHMRRWFGATGVRVWTVRFPVPGAPFILGAGFVLLGIAGALDLTWHSLFGLDETNWSTPHSMIGCALFLIYLGFAACRLALAAQHPISRAGAFIILLLVLTFSGIGLGPLAGNVSPAAVHALAIKPLYLREPAAEHSFRIYLHWNLTRTNPLFVPLAAVWVGSALTLARKLEPRWGVYLLVALLWSTGLPPGPLVVLLAFLLGMTRLPTWLIWGLCGALFGLVGAYAWDNPSLALPLAAICAPLMAFGNGIGTRLGGILKDPLAGGGYRFVFLGLIIPLCTGIVDLYLRLVTP